MLTPKTFRVEYAHKTGQQDIWREIVESGVKALAEKMVDEGKLFINKVCVKGVGVRNREEYSGDKHKPTEYADIWESGMVSEKQYYTCYEKLCYGDGGYDSEESENIW